MAWGANRRLDDHIEQCGERHQDVLKRIRSLGKQARAEHDELRTELVAMAARTAEMHQQNSARGEKTQALVVKFGFGIVTILLALAASQHI